MKYFNIRLVALIWLLSLAPDSWAQGIQFFQGSFDEALKEAKAQNKSLFVDFYATWCVPCKKMAKNEFTKKEVGDYFNSHFISLQIDAEKPENTAIAQRYKVEAFPTIAIISPEGKPLVVNVGAMDAKGLIEMGKTATGETKSFEDLYKEHRANPSDLNLQQELLLQTPRFLAAQEGMDAEKWVVRMRKLYQGYIATKMADNSLINRQDYVIITTLGGDEPEETDKMIDYINAHLPQWREIIGDVASYYIIEKNEERITALAKAGDPAYKTYIERIPKEYAEAYQVVSTGGKSVYDKSKWNADALFVLYKDKNVAEYIRLMNKYFAELGEEVIASDYGRAAQSLYNAAHDKLKKQDHEQAISWLQQALKGKVNPMDNTNYLVMIGDSYKELKKYDEAQKYYNQAYAETLLMTEMEQAQQMLQGAIQYKLSTLDLLR